MEGVGDEAGEVESLMADQAACVVRLRELGGQGQSCEKYMPKVERAYYQKQRTLWRSECLCDTGFPYKPQHLFNVYRPPHIADTL